MAEEVKAVWAPTGSFFNGTHYVIRQPSTPIPDTEKKPMIVFVHGIGSYHVCFNHMADLKLGNGFSVLQYDLIGRAFSEPSANGKYGEEEHIEQLRSLLDHVLGGNVQECHVIAHSMGGALATVFSARYPQYVKTLILLSPAGMMGFLPLGLLRNATCVHGFLRNQLRKYSEQEKIWRQEFILKKDRSLELENECVQQQTAMFENAWDKWIEAFVGSALTFPLMDITEHIQTLANRADLPILLLWGRKDGAVPYNNKKKWTALLKKGACKLQHVSYENAAHMFFVEYMEQVHPEILNFLNSFVDVKVKSEEANA